MKAKYFGKIFKEKHFLQDFAVHQYRKTKMYLLELFFTPLFIGGFTENPSMKYRGVYVKTHMFFSQYLTTLSEPL